MINHEDKIIFEKNIGFFQNNQNYLNQVKSIDTYKIIFTEITNLIKNSENLLDIGHGGCFDYDTSKVKKIIGLDLDEMINKKKIASNIELKTGSATNIPKDIGSFDSVLLSMLLHHLVGKKVKDNFDNLLKCLKEVFRVVKPGGRLIIVESCVPPWFFFFEKLLYSSTRILIEKYLKHPPAFQYTSKIIKNELTNIGFKKIIIKKLKQGKYILQYGIKFPTILTPVQTVIFIAYK